MIPEHFKIFNNGTLKQLPSGTRNIIALIGRKWITIIEWSTLDTTKISFKKWESLDKVPTVPCISSIKRIMRARKKYVNNGKFTNIIRKVYKNL
jgi:hypothetical protein